MNSRRKFVKTAAVSLVLLPLAGTVACGTNKRKMKDLFIHQVYFWLKNPDRAEDRDKLVEGLKSLAAIRTIADYHIGVPAGSSRDVVDGSYALSWLTMFEDKAAQDAYQVDPIHLRFVADYQHLWERVVVYDSVDY
jgi:hypothetical protein